MLVGKIVVPFVGFAIRHADYLDPEDLALAERLEDRIEDALEMWIECDQRDYHSTYVQGRWGVGIDLHEIKNKEHILHYLASRFTGWRIDEEWSSKTRVFWPK